MASKNQVQNLIPRFISFGQQLGQAVNQWVRKLIRRPVSAVKLVTHDTLARQIERYLYIKLEFEPQIRPSIAWKNDESESSQSSWRMILPVMRNLLPMIGSMHFITKGSLSLALYSLAIQSDMVHALALDWFPVAAGGDATILAVPWALINVGFFKLQRFLSRERPTIQLWRLAGFDSLPSIRNVRARKKKYLSC